MFNIGDQVKIVAKVEVPNIGWNDDMERFVGDGQVYTISGLYRDGQGYILDGAGTWTWPHDSLELVAVERFIIAWMRQGYDQFAIHWELFTREGVDAFCANPIRDPDAIFHVIPARSIETWQGRVKVGD